MLSESSVDSIRLEAYDLGGVRAKFLWGRRPKIYRFLSPGGSRQAGNIVYTGMWELDNPKLSGSGRRLFAFALEQ
jgi:hypothetical protein